MQQLIKNDRGIRPEDVVATDPPKGGCPGAKSCPERMPGKMRATLYVRAFPAQAIIDAFHFPEGFFVSGKDEADRTIVRTGIADAILSFTASSLYRPQLWSRFSSSGS